MRGARREHSVEQAKRGDSEPIGGDIVDGEIAAEKKLACERLAKGIESGILDEATKFDPKGDKSSGGRDEYGSDAGQERHKRQVEGNGPERGAAVLPIKQGQRQMSPEQAQRDCGGQ
jgi:hypothetical protein